MLFDPPSDDDLYDALVARDPSFEGRAYVGVTTTGVFCRLTCAARKPAAGFESPSGFRAAFARILGAAPVSFTGKELLRADWIDTPLGAMIAVADRSKLHLLEFFDRKALPAELDKLKRLVKGSIGVGRLEPTEQIADELAHLLRCR